MTKIKQDNDVTNHKGVAHAKNKNELLWSIESYVIYDENHIEKWYITDLIRATYVENETNLSWRIRLSVVCHVNQVGQWHDQSYNFDLRWKPY